jgi:protein-disulfide isomerase
MKNKNIWEKRNKKYIIKGNLKLSKLDKKQNQYVSDNVIDINMKEDLRANITLTEVFWDTFQSYLED